MPRAFNMLYNYDLRFSGLLYFSLAGEQVELTNGSLPNPLRSFRMCVASGRDRFKQAPRKELQLRTSSYSGRARQDTSSSWTSKTKAGGKLLLLALKDRAVRRMKKLKVMQKMTSSTGSGRGQFSSGH
jgi:hypothetical protein